MKARHIILLALSALPLLGAEEAGTPLMFQPMKCGLTEQQLKDAGVPEELVRMSVGIENIDDIIADLEKGFAAVGKKLELNMVCATMNL